MDYTYKCMYCITFNLCDRRIRADSEDCNKLRDKYFESRVNGVFKI